ncbi:hypothetical protein [Rhodococcus sp. LB1]|uniref:hypothetical protein n=1 Tax=Rhodococcus sp. LB1 TaxID=1807499 RepID=UPI000A747009|nr:hypothetical protein [Rhodococcus sp. LB1]
MIDDLSALVDADDLDRKIRAAGIVTGLGKWQHGRRRPQRPSPDWKHARISG